MENTILIILGVSGAIQSLFWGGVAFGWYFGELCPKTYILRLFKKNCKIIGKYLNEQCKII